jgi:hypothetical protein
VFLKFFSNFLELPVNLGRFSSFQSVQACDALPDVFALGVHEVIAVKTFSPELGLQ